MDAKKMWETRFKEINDIVERMGERPIEGFKEWLIGNWQFLDNTDDEEKYTLFLWSSNKRRLVAQTAINMSNVILSEDFQDWLYENWEEVDARHEFSGIMELYLRGE